jgi:hypothetical protein
MWQVEFYLIVLSLKIVVLKMLYSIDYMDSILNLCVFLHRISKMKILGEVLSPCVYKWDSRFSAVSVKSTIFWDVILWSLVRVYHDSSKESVNLYGTTQHQTPEDGTLDSPFCESLEFHLGMYGGTDMEVHFCVEDCIVLAMKSTLRPFLLGIWLN